MTSGTYVVHIGHDTIVKSFTVNANTEKQAETIGIAKFCSKVKIMPSYSFARKVRDLRLR